MPLTRIEARQFVGVPLTSSSLFHMGLREAVLLTCI